MVVAFAIMGVPLAAQEEGAGGKVNVTLDFSATALSVNNDGDVDSFTDSGFGDDNESTLGFSYENEFFGGVASLGFGPQTFRFFDGEMADGMQEKLFSIDKLYAWIKPFGDYFKFSAGIFENTDGVADYTDDIDNFGMGVFVFGEGGGAFTEPTENTNVALVNGFLPEVTFGPVTAQFLFSPNFSKNSANIFFDDYMNTTGLNALGLGPSDVDSRLFRIGGRIIANIGVGTVSALFKLNHWPMAAWNTSRTIAAMMSGEPSPAPYGGTAVDNMTFGVYADITAVENLGISLGYTGFIVASDENGVDNVLWNGIDLRATWTGIEGLSISTHNNISFAKGSDKEWTLLLRGDDSSFLTLYNAIGATVTLTERFGINGEIGNVFSKTDRGGTGDIDYDTFWGQLKLITAVTENAEFTVGVRVDYITQNDVDDSTVFSVPVGIKVSF
ncbi:MAG: hypothetical protein LBF83_10340 [Spirochaetaceae bacterium]|nr:hypothetical protein [Spirochaetaceae bacterium]